MISWATFPFVRYTPALILGIVGYLYLGANWPELWPATVALALLSMGLTCWAVRRPRPAATDAAGLLSLLTIVATSWRSLGAHRAHGAVDEEVLRTWTPWVGAGALIGAAVAGLTSMEGLAIVYGVCLALVAAQMGLLPERVTLRGTSPLP